MVNSTVRRRSRHLSPYREVGHRFHSSVSSLLESPADEAVHTFKESSRVVDIIYELNDSDSDTLIVSFPAAMTTRHRTFPYFNGRRAARNATLPLLAFSDPAFGVSHEILTGWTLGDSSYLLHRDIPKIINKFRSGRRIIFTGISAGGFPALHFANLYPESMCLVVNPRTALLTAPTHLHFSASRLFPGASIADIAELIPTRTPYAQNHVLFAQNISDDRYTAAHMLPYAASNEGNERVFFLLDDWGDGHVPMSPEEYSRSLSVLATSNDWKTGIEALRGESYGTAHELALAHAQSVTSAKRLRLS